ncbi:V-set and immunoglobulin domain-containing protein 4 isoform X7 [Phascolarctos cinereus]
MTSMALFLAMALLAHLSGHLSADPTLEGPVKMIGPWKGNVNVACTYGPLKGYTQVQVKWLVQQDNEVVTIFLRDSSGDHIQQAKYRGRLQVNREPPGDVSLLLETLEMDDRGRYQCQVTWKVPDGRQLVKERMTELQIQKHSSKRPTSTMLPEELTASTPHPEVIHQSTTATPARDQTSTIDSFLGASTIGLATETSSRKQTTMDAGHAGASSERPGSTSDVASRDQGNASKRAGGQGLPLYAIILIALLCIALVFATLFGLCRRKSQDEHTYEVARMSTDGPRVAVYSGGTAEAEAETRALENEYHDDPARTQDYQIITQANSDYARLLCGSSSAELEIQENGKPSR